MIYYLLCFLCVFTCIEGSQKGKKTVCANLIVKNESAVITRCLGSLLPIIDYWVIVDTGSTDDTQQIIKDFMKSKGIPGELFERPWVNFEHNRNEALQLAKNKGDYVFFIDADEYLVYDPDFQMPQLDKDSYFVTMTYGGTKYGKMQLVKNSLGWEWQGVLHEALFPNPASDTRSSGTIEKVTTIYTTEGARSKDPQKYQKDAQILEAALKKDPTNARYVFYLARSYRDAENSVLALQNFEKRVAMGGWDEEVFESLLEIALLQESLNMDKQKIVNSYNLAFRYRPTRSEPLYYCAHYLREQKDYAAAYRIAKLGSTIPIPKDVLFVQNWIYSYAMTLELSACAYWTERYEECQKLSLDLLKIKDLPDDIRATVENNLSFANAKLLMEFEKVLDVR